MKEFLLDIINFFHKNKNKIFYFSLFFLILFATLIRVLYISETIEWMDDVRDLMVVKYLVDWKDGFFVSPLASQGYSLLNNTPVYFWILSVFYMISGNLLGGTIFFFVLLGIATILLNFLWAKELAGKKVAFFVALFSTISIIFVKSSRSILQPYLNNFIFSLFLFSFIFSIKKKNSLTLILSTFLIFLAVTVHLSFLAIVPIVFIVQVVVLRKISKNDKDFLLSLIWYLVFLLFLSLVYLYLSDLTMSFSPFRYFLEMRKYSRDVPTAEISFSPLFLFFKYLTESNYAIFSLIFFFLLIIEIIIIKKGKSNVIKENNLSFYSLLFIFLILLSFIFIKIYFPFFYFFPFYSIFFFLLAVIIDEIFYIDKLIFIFVSLLVTQILFRGSYRYFLDIDWSLGDNRTSDFFYTAKDLSSKINSDIEENNYENFIINTSRVMYEAPDMTSMVFDWDNLSFYYFLEEMNNKKYLKLVNSYSFSENKSSINNFLIGYDSEMTPDVIYFSCIVRDAKLLRDTNISYLNKNYCLQPYLKFIEDCYDLKSSEIETQLMFSDLDYDLPAPLILYKLTIPKKEMNLQCLSYHDYVEKHKSLIPQAFPWDLK